ncbi:MAG: hypothetical protein DCC71_05685 [Proteobacteria bacterium]|nr:MAG: hypothetical protein DCC71_05685 [Pseudomonadota bacterium]
MKRSLVVGLLACALGSGALGCANMTPAEQRALSGGAIGAAGGALLGASVGHAGTGAAIGGAVGAGSGYLYEKNRDR